jgi:hypothetical protein
MAGVLLADLRPLFNEALEALFSRGNHTVVGRCGSAEETWRRSAVCSPSCC